MQSPKCPKCNSPELHDNLLLIRAYKVFDSRGAWSQCLVCAGYYDSDLNYRDTGNPAKGWFYEKPGQ